MQSFLISNGNPKNRQKWVEKLVGQPIASLENNPDFILLSAIDTAIGIDQVREMQSNLALKPFAQKQKFCIIFEAQNLTPEAQNALLKTLEEPPGNCQIILTAGSASFLLPTIVSRCQIISLPIFLQEISAEEESSLSDLLNNLIAASCGKKLLLLEKEGVAKDRQTATLWLDKLTIILRKKLLELPPNSRQYLDILHNVNLARSRLSLNTNVRLVMENFLLDLNLTPRECLR